jgi:hypothetical protein
MAVARSPATDVVSTKPNRLQHFVQPVQKYAEWEENMRVPEMKVFLTVRAVIPVCTFLLALSMLVVLSLTVNPTYAGTLPSPVKKPLPLMVPKGPAAEAVRNRAELRIVRVDRIGSGPIQPGQVVPTNVVIANSGRASATVSAASVGPSGSVNRSRVSDVIPSRGQATIRLDIPVDARQIRANQFRTTVGIVKPNVAGSRGWLDQIWKDSNKNDNAMEVRYEVDATFYRVSVFWSKLVVHNDCDDDGPGEWRMGFNAYTTNEHPRDIDLNFLGGDRPRNVYQNISNHWRHSVSSGRTYMPNSTLVLNNVHAGQYISVRLSGSDSDAPLNSEIVGIMVKVLSPDEWQRGAKWRRRSGRTEKCGYGAFTAYFQVIARPVTVH